MEVANNKDADISAESEQRDLLSLKEYIDELDKRQQWKAHMRLQNSDLTKRLDENGLRKLDSSLKKVTTRYDKFLIRLPNFFPIAM